MTVKDLKEIFKTLDDEAKVEIYGRDVTHAWVYDEDFGRLILSHGHPQAHENYEYEDKSHPNHAMPSPEALIRMYTECWEYRKQRNQK
jgi:hypothetical protein